MSKAEVAGVPVTTHPSAVPLDPGSVDGALLSVLLGPAAGAGDRSSGSTRYAGIDLSNTSVDTLVQVRRCRLTLSNPLYASAWD